MKREMTLYQAMYIANNLREDDQKEILATRWSDDLDRFAIDAFNYTGPKMCICLPDRTPVVMGGVSLITPGVGQAWMVATDEIDKVGHETTRVAQNMMKVLLDDGVVHRIQAVSASFHIVAHQWLRFIGFNNEEPLACYGKEKEDFIMFSMIKG